MHMNKETDNMSLILLVPFQQIIIYSIMNKLHY